MQIEPQVSFRNVEKSETLERKILEGIDKLERVHDRITSLRMAVEDQSGGADTPDRLFRVRLDITVPGGEIVVEQKPNGEPHPPLDRQINDAFDAARRKLKRVLQRQRGHVKTHQPKLTGRVVRTFPEENYGFIQDPDGRDVYFHANSVQHEDVRLADLEPGDPVEFEEEQGDKGPQAVAVFPG